MELGLELAVVGAAAACVELELELAVAGEASSAGLRGCAAVSGRRMACDPRSPPVTHARLPSKNSGEPLCLRLLWLSRRGDPPANRSVNLRRRRDPRDDNGPGGFPLHMKRVCLLKFRLIIVC